MTEVYLDKDKASKARIQELERQLAAIKQAPVITTELPFPAIQESKLPIEGTAVEMEQIENLEAEQGHASTSKGASSSRAQETWKKMSSQG